MFCSRYHGSFVAKEEMRQALIKRLHFSYISQVSKGYGHRRGAALIRGDNGSFDIRDLMGISVGHLQS